MKHLMIILMAFLAFSLYSCDSDSDNGTEPNDDKEKIWQGTWLSTGSDVAPILVALFKYDSVRVTLNDDLTVVLESHIKDGAWSTLNGVYTVTQPSDKKNTDILAIKLDYSVFAQDGIIQVTKGSPDTFQLEAVQTNPSIGATVPTAEKGFGQDPALGVTNIQKYKRIK